MTSLRQTVEVWHERVMRTVIVESNCHILQFLHQMFSVSALLLDDALKPVTEHTVVPAASHARVQICC